MKITQKEYDLIYMAMDERPLDQRPTLSFTEVSNVKEARETCLAKGWPSEVRTAVRGTNEYLKFNVYQGEIEIAWINYPTNNSNHHYYWELTTKAGIARLKEFFKTLVSETDNIWGKAENEQTKQPRQSSRRPGKWQIRAGKTWPKLRR